MGRMKKQRLKEEKERKQHLKKSTKKKPQSIYEVCTVCHKKKPLWYDTEEDIIKHENGKCKKCLTEIFNAKNQED